MLGEFNVMGDTVETPIVDTNCGTPTPIVDTEENLFVGKLFESIEAARDCYEKYAKKRGFPIFLRSSKSTRNHYKEPTSALFVCSHYGEYGKKVDENVPVEKRRVNTSTMRWGCKASMSILLDIKTKDWLVRKFVDDHNHDLVRTPNKTLMKTSRTRLPEGAKAMVELFSQENLPVNKVTSIVGGDAIGISDRDCWNHLRDIRQRLDIGDAQWLHLYFKKRQAENPQFYYDIQIDKEGRAVNFFWVDARSILAYQQFGDVVTFDTTYKTNKYSLPFAPFTGVNHHNQTIQFGWGLLQDETEASFLWLFQTWKKAMGGIAPISLITDSDPAMRAAIPKVFPNTRHKLCYWHIKMKFGEKLAHVYFKKSAFKKEMKQCLKYTYRVEDFENMWKELMVKYELENNSWLMRLYEDRELWVPVYNRTTFFAGMHTTGRSEGVNSFFKDYVNSTTSLKEFVEKRDQAVARIESRERAEDHESEQKSRLVTDKSFILKHACDIYTRNLFKKFSSMWRDVELFRADVVISEPEKYTVKFKRGTASNHWVVKLNPITFEGECECHYFEFAGLPCVHLMKVFSKLDFDEIPGYFINRRWLKGANRFRVQDKVKTISQKQTDAMRFNHLCREATQWACVAYQTEKRYNLFLNGIRELGEKISQLSEAKEDSQEAPRVPVLQEISELPPILLDPKVSQTKGRCKEPKENSKVKTDERFKRPIELAKEKKGRMCAYCKSIQTHDKRNCPKKLKLDEEAGVSDE